MEIALILVKSLHILEEPLVTFENKEQEIYVSEEYGGRFGKGAANRTKEGTELERKYYYIEIST